MLYKCDICGKLSLPSTWTIQRKDGSQASPCTQCANNAIGDRDVKTLTIKE